MYIFDEIKILFSFFETIIQKHRVFSIQYHEKLYFIFRNNERIWISDEIF